MASTFISLSGTQPTDAGTETYSLLYKLDLRQMRGATVRCSGTAPRNWSCSTATSGNCIYVLEGSDRSLQLTRWGIEMELSVLDTTNYSWSRLVWDSPEGVGEMPGAWKFSCAAELEGRMMMMFLYLGG